MMRTKKFGTCLLLILMLFSLTFFVGCGKDKGEVENDNNQDSEVNKNDNNQKEDETTTSQEENHVVLLKRNGVEWKENSSIASQQGAEKYTVVWGDTLSLIARAWNVNTYTLASYNGITNIDLIEVDQVIYNYTYHN